MSLSKRTGLRLSRLGVIVVASIVLWGVVQTVHAEESSLFVRLDAPTIQKGYTAELPGGDFRMGIWPGVLDIPTSVSLQRLTANPRPLPAGARVVSSVFQFDFLRDDGTSDALVLSKPYTLAIRFSADNTWRKSIRYYDDNRQAWIPLPSTTDFQNGYVRAITHLPFSRVAVFEDDVLQEGRASYYSHPGYPNQMIAASRDYAFGTQLLVENLENGKTVTVTVKDYGPDGARYPERIVDISRTAFAELAPLSRGTIPVRVTSVAPKVLGASVQRVVPPSIASKAAMVIDAETGRMLYEKNPDAVMPIASMTKIVTASVFLDLGIPWDTVVTYESADEAIGSRLRVSPGETMTVKDLFYSALTGSANNATNALVRATGLTRADFAARMNARAKEWGTTYTSYDDLTGLSENNVSTAREYAMIARQVFTKFDTLAATTISAYGFRTINTDVAHTITNRNKMVGTAWYLTGTKTGYTDEALYTLITKARKTKDGRDVIVVILGSATDSQRYAETDALLKHGFAVLESGQ